MVQKPLLFTILLFSVTSIFSQIKSQTVPTGQWLVVSEQMSFIKDNKVIKTFPVEPVSKQDAYVYNFISSKLLSISNLSNDFDWRFSLKISKNKLELVNIHADAEDDELTFELLKDQLILKRRMEDADPDDEEAVLTVQTKMILRKI